MSTLRRFLRHKLYVKMIRGKNSISPQAQFSPCVVIPFIYLYQCLGKNVAVGLTGNHSGGQGIVKSEEHSCRLGHVKSGLQEGILVCGEVYERRGAQHRRQYVAHEDLVGHQPAE